MTEPDELDADALRAQGIDPDGDASDEELVAIVRVLLNLGLTVDEMVGQDLAYLPGPHMIRPDATLDPATALHFERDPDFARKSGLALGFDLPGDSFKLTPAEVNAVKFFHELRPLLGDDNLLALMRVTGTSLARVARSVVSSLRLNYETPIVEETGSFAEVAQSYSALIQEQLPPFLDATAAVLRRHLARAISQPTVWNVDQAHSATMELLIVGFVDLVGFTSFTERAGAKQFIKAVTAFEGQAQEAVVSNGGTLVKLIGDEAMFVAPTADAAMAIARRMSSPTFIDAGPTSVRVGLASGEVAALGGDYYGMVVNVAARIVSEAEPGEIVVTKSVAAEASATTFEPIGARHLRGISEPVDLYRAVG